MNFCWGSLFMLYYSLYTKKHARGEKKDHKRAMGLGATNDGEARDRFLIILTLQVHHFPLHSPPPLNSTPCPPVLSPFHPNSTQLLSKEREKHHLGEPDFSDLIPYPSKDLGFERGSKLRFVIIFQILTTLPKTYPEPIKYTASNSEDQGCGLYVYTCYFDWYW